MSVWQNTMIRFARNQALRRMMQGNVLTRRLATRFVGGNNIAQAVARVVDLEMAGFRTSLYYLGEYVDDEQLIEENVVQILNAAQELGQAGVDVHLSIDPTQIGYALSEDIGWRNARRIGEAVPRPTSRGRNVVMLDMEDSAYVEKTLNLHMTLLSHDIPTAITIQAYLHRSEADIRQLIERGAIIRLVKGAFAETKDVALVHKSDINRNYLRLAELLLSQQARERGVYPIFATHDEQMMDAIKPVLRDNHWTADSYEYEMLYGVRPALQKQLREARHAVRLYLPFGTEWWPYTARRVGERPANAVFIWQALWNQ